MRASPPIMVPNAEPRFMAAVSMDIIVPRSLGTCSSERLLADEATMPENRQAPKTRAM